MEYPHQENGEREPAMLPDRDDFRLLLAVVHQRSFSRAAAAFARRLGERRPAACTARPSRVRSLPIFVSVILGLSSPAVAGEVVADYAQNMSFLPARIAALHFAAGPMDQKRAIAWGFWTVRFGEATPVATPFRGQGQVNSFEIPLQCENNELGTRECTIEIDEIALNVAVCRISDGERVNMQVACPKSIELAR